MEKYGSLSKNYFQKIHGAAFIFARDSDDSLEQIRTRWLEVAANLAPDTTMRFLIANKNELDEVQVYKEMIDELVDNPMNKIDGHYEVSGKENANIDETFRDIALKMYQRFSEYRPS